MLLFFSMRDLLSELGSINLSMKLHYMHIGLRTNRLNPSGLG
jgi:hypothetical protein